MRALLLALVTAGMAWGAVPPAALTPAQMKLRLERDQMWGAAGKAWKDGKQEYAITLMKKAIEIEVRVVGPWHRIVDVMAGVLGYACQARGEWGKEAECRRVIIEARSRLYGAGHWLTVDARLMLADALAQQKRTLVQRDALQRGLALSRQGVALRGEGKLAQALPLAKQAQEFANRILGERHRDHATSLSNLAELHYAMGDNQAALPLYKRALAIRKEVQGPRHPEYATALSNLAVLHQAMSDHKAALALTRQTLAIRKEVLGTRHLGYAHSLNNLASLHQEMGDHKAALSFCKQAVAINKEVLGERHPEYAHSLNNLATLHLEMGDHKAALALLEKALAIRKAALGERHPEYATSLNNLAELYRAMGDHKAALPLFRQALALIKGGLGVRHPHYATSINNLALLHQAMGDHEAALALFRQALALRKELLGGRHPDYATSLNNLALLHQAMGDHKAAQSLYKQALALRKDLLGERHFRYADSLNDLALLHQAMGDHEAALPLLTRVLALRKEMLGGRHPDYANSLYSLANLHMSMGDNQATLPLFKQALALYQEVLGERHPSYAESLNGLALLHQHMGDYEAALPTCKQALALRKEVLGVRHPHYANSLNNLASLLREMGDHEAALPLFRQALALRKEVLGGRHPDYAQSLNNLAVMYVEMGRPGTALALQEQSLALSRHHLSAIASVQSERQQIAATDALRYRLHWRLSTPDEAARFSHNHALSWKGASFAAQQSRRALQAQADPASRAIAQELLDATRSLALVSSRADDASRKRAERFTLVKEEKEAELARLSEPFAAALRPPASEAFRASLPPNVALVDLLAYDGFDPEKPIKGQEWQRRLAAWVVRADAATVRIDLGPMKPIEDAIASWRKALEAGGRGSAEGVPPLVKGGPPGLRGLVWEPLERHLAGARLVLVSPDGAMGRLPFAALPGRRQGTFLLEEVPLAVLPIPQVLPRLLEPAKGKPSLLTLGNVEFGDGPGTWIELPATGPEADAIAARFRARIKGDVVTLSGAKATKAALREALPRHRYAHLATHGYFAPASMKSALDHDDTKPRDGLLGREGVTGWNPGLLSGLVLAGANRPTTGDDGVLTATEIAEMDLSGLALAVLSACQTGLGKEAGGEGMLGLQRAFALAGCKSVVSSLWSVHDAATSVLMERFYFHLWERKLSKLESLRQAQLDILRNPDWVREREKKLAGVRGLRGVGKVAEEIVAGKKEKRSPPAWWAAWQLSR